MDFGIASVAAITVICYLIGQVVKASGVDNKSVSYTHLTLPTNSRG